MASIYEFVVQGHLDPRWSEWLDGMVVAQSDDGTSTLTGPVTDQAALFGRLNRIRDLGLTLISVQQIPPNKQEA
jgi:hypothetical protein